MQKADLFQWVELKQDVPDSLVKKGNKGVVLDFLSPNSKQKEAGYIIEVFKDGKTLDVVSVPTSWIIPLPEFWGTSIPEHTAFLNGYVSMDERLYVPSRQISIPVHEEDLGLAKLIEEVYVYNDEVFSKTKALAYLERLKNNDLDS